MPVADNVRDFAAIVRRRRRDLGLSQSELAARVGRTRQWVSNLESGATTNPGLPDALQLVLELGLIVEINPDPDFGLGTDPPADA